MALSVQPSFAAGELAPELHGRIDIAKYGIGLARAYNCFVHAHGGLSNRAGLEFVGPVANHAVRGRLVPFEFNTEQTYVLEFGEQVMRPVKDGGQVLESAKAITGATAANPVVVTSAAHGFENGDKVFIAGVVGMTRLNGRTFTVANKTTDTFQLSGIDGSGYAAYVSGGTVARLYAVTAPYTAAELAALKFTQSADVMTLCHRSHDVTELSRTGHASWSFDTVTFAPAVSRPSGLAASAATGGSVTHRYRVTAIAEETAEESLPAIGATQNITAATAANPVVITIAGHGWENGDEVEINGVGGMTELNGRRFIVADKTTDTFELEGEDGSGYTAYTSGGTAARTFVAVTTAALSATNYVDVSITPQAGAVRYDVYREKSGIYGYIGTTETGTFRDDNIAPDVDASPPASRNPFVGAGNKPGAVSYYEQRRVFGGSTNKPDTQWYSRIGLPANMTVSTPGQDDDAITATLNALKVNDIRHIVPLDDLLIMTSGAEWKVGSGADSAFAFSTLRQKPQSYWGCADVAPVVIGNVVLFVQAGGQYVRNLAYNLSAGATGGYESGDLAILANHLFEGRTVVEWAYAPVPHSLVWCVMSDGKLLSLTYNREQEVIAWTQHETDGWFESVASVPEGTETGVYFIVRREIGGQTVRYIERLHSRYFEDVEDCFFLDSGVTYDGTAATEITGLDHLEGETVKALADGNVVSNLTVTGGKVTLPQAASVVHVGLPYTAQAQTLDVEMANGNVQGRLKKIVSVTLRFLKSRGLWIGPTSDNLDEVKWRDAEAMGAATDLFTGKKVVDISPDWNSNGRIWLEQRDPLPMTIQFIAPNGEVGG